MKRGWQGPPFFLAPKQRLTRWSGCFRRGTQQCRVKGDVMLWMQQGLEWLGEAELQPQSPS